MKVCIHSAQGSLIGELVADDADGPPTQWAGPMSDWIESWVAKGASVQWILERFGMYTVSTVVGDDEECVDMPEGASLLSQLADFNEPARGNSDHRPDRRSLQRPMTTLE